jgi:adenylate cyclase
MGYLPVDAPTFSRIRLEVPNTFRILSETCRMTARRTVQRQIDKMNNSFQSKTRFGQHTIDWGRGTIGNVGTTPVALRAQTLGVLKILTARPGQLVSKEELLQEVWHDIAVTEDSIVQCITEIRKAIGGDARAIIKTVPKRGYVFEPEIHAVSAPARLADIAVLPFEEMNGDPELGYFGVGVSADIISMLARSSGLSVIARNSSFAYKGKAIDIRRIGRELGVRYVLEGSLRKTATTLRIVADLIDAETGVNVWAERFDMTGADPLALQDEVAGQIVATLAGARGMVERARYREAWGKDTANLAEYDSWLRGVGHCRQHTPESIKLAETIWHEELRKFPESASLQTALGWCHFKRFHEGWNEQPDDFRRANEFLQRAISQHDLTPIERRDSYWLRAFLKVYSKEFELAISDAELVATALVPFDACAKGDLAVVLLCAGKPQLALEWIDWAINYDPVFADTYHDNKGLALRILERYAESREAYSKGSLRPGLIALSAAVTEVCLNQFDCARDLVRKALDDDPSWTLAKVRRTNNVYKDPSILEREIAALALAGLPER